MHVLQLSLIPPSKVNEATVCVFIDGTSLAVFVSSYVLNVLSCGRFAFEFLRNLELQFEIYL